MLPKPSLATALASANDFWAFSPREDLTAGVVSRLCILTAWKENHRGVLVLLPEPPPQKCKSVVSFLVDTYYQSKKQSQINSLHSTFPKHLQLELPQIGPSPVTCVYPVTDLSKDVAIFHWNGHHSGHRHKGHTGQWCRDAKPLQGHLGWIWSPNIRVK